MKMKLCQSCDLLISFFAHLRYYNCYCLEEINAYQSYFQFCEHSSIENYNFRAMLCIILNYWNVGEFKCNGCSQFNGLERAPVAQFKEGSFNPVPVVYLERR